MRAVEPRQPLIRRIPAQKDEGPPAYRPTIDLSSSNWGTKATLRALENRWQAAVKAHDVDALDKFLDEDFVGTSSSGKTASKARLLRELKDDKNVYRSAKTRGISVRMNGPKIAVVTGTATETGQKEDGTNFIASRRFTDTWNLRQAGWKCVASEVTTVSKR